MYLRTTSRDKVKTDKRDAEKLSEQLSDERLESKTVTICIQKYKSFFDHIHSLDLS
ncbi:hypothetical protein Lnau_2320 [Legionella nautarum]|uniref:Uncharacterized protein n=1 Tax=Legionella nautarum TaxID=45070 RepID=A0A0W0WMM3_9GAMM|nr:hypothetical protein Lnau_2320 [Legionella nautarum]